MLANCFLTTLSIIQTIQEHAGLLVKQSFSRLSLLHVVACQGRQSNLCCVFSDQLTRTRVLSDRVSEGATVGIMNIYNSIKPHDPAAVLKA